MRRIATALALSNIVTGVAAAQSRDGDGLVVVLGDLAGGTGLVSAKADVAKALEFTSSAGPVDPENRADPRNLDIAGVRLGMGLSEAKAALRMAGYARFAEDDQPSYKASVLSEWAIRYGYKSAVNERAPSELVWRKGDEEVRVKMIALPEGPQVTAVTYWAREAPISSEDFVQRVRSKYGEPVNDSTEDLRWCTVRAPDCEGVNEAQYPLLAATPANRMIYLIGGDPARSEALSARFEADVERGKPAGQALSF